MTARPPNQSDAAGPSDRPPNQLAALDPATLFGDLRDAILARLRAMPKPWTVMSEADQRDMIDGVERVARELVTAAVRLVAANGRPSVPALLESCTVKRGVKATLSMVAVDDPTRHMLFDHVGQTVLVVAADPQSFLGEKDKAKPDPDTPPLPLGGGGPVGKDSGNVKPLRGRPPRKGMELS